MGGTLAKKDFNLPFFGILNDLNTIMKNQKRMYRRIITWLSIVYLGVWNSVNSLYIARDGGIWYQTDETTVENTGLQNNTNIHLRGISWFGFETQDFVINGLWVHPMKYYVDLLRENEINFIRVPFSAEWIYYNWDLYPYDGLVSADFDNQHKKSIEILDRLVDLLEENGMFIMFDLHRLHKEYISELWYSPTDDKYPSSIFFDSWFRLLDRYANRTHLLAIDLLNEPHGKATYGSDDPSTDWRLFVESAIPQFQQRYPNASFLFVVEGINWGHDLSLYKQYPLRLSIPNRVVFSPHVYGKSVVSSTDTSYPPALWNEWYSSFAYLRELNESLIIGEWGGQTTIDKYWMTLFTDYLKTKNIRDNCFWSVGPNSGDVQGWLLDDWTTIDQFKNDRIQKLQPVPTFF